MNLGARPGKAAGRGGSPLERGVRQHLRQPQSMKVHVSAPSKRRTWTDSFSRSSKLLRFTPCLVPGCAWLRIERLPVRYHAASLAPNRAEGLVTPDVLVGALGMPLYEDRSELVVRPQTANAPAQRAIAVGCLLRSAGKREANCTTVAGSLERRWWLFSGHGECTRCLCAA
jgi:hypothetical protein